MFQFSANRPDDGAGLIWIERRAIAALVDAQAAKRIEQRAVCRGHETPPAGAAFDEQPAGLMAFPFGFIRSAGWFGGISFYSHAGRQQQPARTADRRPSRHDNRLASCDFHLVIVHSEVGMAADNTG